MDDYSKLVVYNDESCGKEHDGRAMQDAAEGPTLASYDGATLASVSLIWCLVAFNFYVLAVRRHGQQAWGGPSLLVGYGGLALHSADT